MIGRANVTTNLGLINNNGANSVLKIIAPVTAIVFIKKDGKTIKKINYSKDAIPDGASSDYIYLLSIYKQNFGIYSISSNLSSTIKTIDISEPRIYSIQAPENFYLFKHGDGAIVPLTTGHESNSSCSYNTNEITVNYTSSSSYQILCRNTNAIDLSKWNTINAVGTITARTTDSKYMGYVFAHTATVTVNGDHSGLAAKTAILTGTSEQTTSLDISSVTTATGYVGIVGGMKGIITAIYLER